MLGTIAILLVMEATRRVIGWFLIGVAVVFILYARFSHLMPAIIEAPSTEWDRLIVYLYLDTNSMHRPAAAGVLHASSSRSSCSGACCTR